MSVLAKYTVEDLKLPEPLISVKLHATTLFEVIDLLAGHRLLSVPVLAEDGSLVGMMDGLDVLAYITKCFGQGFEQLEDCPIEQVKNFETMEPVPSVQMETTLDIVAHLISGFARRCVVTKDGMPYSVVTQSLMLQFFREHVSELDAEVLASPAHTRSSPNFCSVSEDITAQEAFMRLAEERASSAGVVDGEGALIMIISATDLVRSLSHMEDKGSALQILRETNVVDYLATERMHDTRARAGAIVVGPDDPFEHVLDKLASCRVHQVVVATNREPRGVIRLADVCRHVGGIAVEI